MTRRFSKHFVFRALAAQAACIIALLAGLGAADAAILVNKAFSPTSVALGGTSTVTVTLQNTSTLNTATVTSFTDDIATMGGTATFASPTNLATTCAGGNPSISGTVVSMSAGTIPVAPSTTVSGTCTISFDVVGAVVGNGVNTIAQGALVTSRGSNGTSASQTLQVTGLAPTVSGSATSTVTTLSQASNVITVTNPNGAALTNVVVPIVGTANFAFTIVSVTVGGAAGCSGTETFPAATAPGQNVTVTLPSIPANAACTITIATTTNAPASANTVTYTVGTTTITDTQGVTNSAATNTKAAFITGRPTITKAFSPSIVTPGGTTTLTIRIPNIETQSLTGVNLTDTLPTPNYLTVDAAPNFTATNCGTPTNTSTGSTVSFTGATVAAATTLGTPTAASTCVITILLDVSGTAPSIVQTNTIPAANLVDDQALPAAGNASANITITATGVSDAKSFSAGTAARLTADRITLTFTNAGSTPLTNGTFTDNLPQTNTGGGSLPMAVDVTTTPLPTYSASCGTTTPTTTYSTYINVDPTQTNQSDPTVITASGITLAAGATCTVTFNIVLAGSVGTDTNTLFASNVSFMSGGSTINAGQNVSASVAAQSAFVTSNYVAAAAGLENQPLNVQATITERATAGVTESNIVATYLLNPNTTTHNVMLAAAPNFTFSGGCSTLTAANVTIGANSESFTVNVPSLSSTCRINYNVVNEQPGSSGVGTFGPGNSTYVSTENPTIVTAGAANNVTFYATSVLVNKTFTPNTITAGATSTAAITLNVRPVAQLATTTATGVGFVDTLPANLSFAPTPSLTFSAGCGSAPMGVISGTTLTVSGVTLTAVGSTATACTVSFSTTSTTLGNVTNSIGASTVTSDSGATNTQAASASLSVAAGVSLAKTFVNATLPIGSTDIIKFVITNSASTSTLSAGTFTDNMPSSLALASTTVPANQAGDPPACGGTISGTIGSSTFTVSGLSVAGTMGGVATQCVQYVLITTTSTATPGSVSNSIPAGALTIGGISNSTGTTGSTTLTPPPAPTISKAFLPTAIAINGTSQLTVTIANTATGSAPLTGVALTDTLPTNVTIAATPAAATTCGGTVTAVAGNGSVALSGGSLAAAASCTITVNVTSATPGSYINTIPVSALTTTQGATNAAAATAPLTVNAPNIVLTKAFAPTSIVPSGTSVLTLTLANTATGNIPLTNVALNDALPTGVTIAATPAASTTCSAATVSATAGGSSVGLSGASLASGATCTVSVSVTSTTVGTYINTVPTGNVTSTEGASNGAPATATLTVANAPAVTLTKAFNPVSIASGANSTLTLTVNNTGTGAVALTGLAVSDTLPTGVTVVNTPGTTTCGAGTITRLPDGSAFSLSGGTLAVGASCTIAVTVTSSTPGSFLNTIPTGALTSTQGATTTAPATATLTVSAPNIVLSKAFAPASIAPTGISQLTVTLANTATGNVALTGVAVSDALPTGVTIAAVPNASTTCGGTVTATAGATSLALTNGALASGATCTIVVSVTSTAPGTYINTIPTGTVTSTQGASNGTPATATLTVANAPPVMLSKVFAPNAIASGGTSTLTVSIANTNVNAIALTSLAVGDTLPTGVVVAATPAAATTCAAGTATATAGGTTLALTGGSLAAGATCTVSVSVTATLPNTYTNTIATGAVSSAQGASNTAPASANLTVSATNVVLSKAFTPASIVPGSSSVLAITIANSAAGSIALSGLAFTDTLPTNVTIAATPAASTTCGAGTVTATAGGTSVALSGGSVGASSTCTVLVSVTSTTIGTYVNTIPTGGLTSTQGASNTVPATATLSVAAGPPVTISKAFAPAAIGIGGTSALTVTIANTATTAVALTNVHLVDTLPTNVTIAATPAASTTCGAGTVTATAGAGSVTLSGGTLAANATCTFTVTVTSSTPGAFVNTIPIAALTSTQGSSNAAPATATLTVSAPPVTLTKAFAPATINPGGISVLTLSIANTATGSVALTGLTLTDTLPTGVTIAATPNASTTCAGTVTGIAGTAAVALAGGSLAAGATCTITISVTSTSVGTYVNTVPAGNITTTQGASNGAAATATLSVVNAPPVTLTKTFTPVSINPNGISVVTLTIANTAAGSVALTGVTLSDTLPTGVTIAATPNAATTCGAGTVTGAAGTSAIALAGGSLAAGATCTITISVTSTTVGTYVNTVPAGNITSTQGASNGAAASATLTVVNAPPVTLSKAFAPASIPIHGTSQLTVTIANTASGAVALTALGVSDTLPTGVTLATTPNGSTTCGSGAVSAASGSASFSLANGTLAAGATCTVTVTVTAAATGTYVNTIPIGAVTSTQGASNTVAAQATLTVVTANLSVTKTSNPSGAAVSPGQHITYTIAIVNSGGAPETNATITDTLTNAALVPGSVTVNGVAASDAVVTSAAPFGTIAAGSTVTIVYVAAVNANAAPNTTVTNSVTVGGDQACSGATCTSTSPPNVVNAPVLTIAKTIDGQTNVGVASGQVVTYGITVSNTGGVSAQGVVVTDPFPAGATPIAGSVTLNGAPATGATVVGQTVTVPVGTIAVGQNAAITVRATISTTGQPIVNVASVAADGLASGSMSNPATASVGSSQLIVSKTADASVVRVGDRVDYTITVRSASGLGYGVTTIVDTLPAYEAYAPGTARINGVHTEPVVHGRTLTWTVPSLTGTLTLSYAVAIVPGAPQNGSLTNIVNVSAVGNAGGAAGVGSASSSITVVATTFGSCYPITGRVYADTLDRGRFLPGDTGLAGVRVYLDDGESVETDAFGRYNFPCVRPGMHAMRLDESTLPAGTAAFDDRRLDSERSTRRLVHRTFDTTIIEDVNFAMRDTTHGP